MLVWRLTVEANGEFSGVWWRLVASGGVWWRLTQGFFQQFLVEGGAVGEGLNLVV
jgi:hypothetical protein